MHHACLCYCAVAQLVARLPLGTRRRVGSSLGVCCDLWFCSPERLSDTAERSTCGIGWEASFRCFLRSQIQSPRQQHLHRHRPPNRPPTATANGSTAPSRPTSAPPYGASCAASAWAAGASSPARATGTTSARSPTPTSTPAATTPPSSYYSCSMVIIVMHTLLTLLEPFVLIQ